MVTRVWIIAGAAFIVVSWVLTVPLSPRPYQGSAATHIDAYRSEGLMPDGGALVMSRAIGHETFEVPAEDAEHTQMTGMSMPSGGDHAGMPGMSMPTEPAHGDMPGMDMAKEPADVHGQMSDMTTPEHGKAGDDAMPGMGMTKEPAEAHDQMPGMTAPEQGQGDHGAMPGMNLPKEPADTHGQMPGMTAPEQNQAEHGAMPDMDMTQESTEAHAQMPDMTAPEQGHGGDGDGGGLRVLQGHGPGAMHVREVRVHMREWGFEPARVDVKPGEVVRLVVRNDGNNPHEFMLMSHAAMAAVNYRLQRADWNLLEHEAFYEREIVMPGDSIEVTLRIEQPGAWMFMCMFPYHMQFGMMGTMATEGIGTDMGDMNM